MPHVEELEHLAFAVLPGGVVPVRDLPPAGDAGLAGEELPLAVPELEQLLVRYGAGPDDRKIAREHIQELRELVDGVLPKEAPDAGHARVVIELLLALPGLQLLVRHVALGVLVGVRDHGPELPDAYVLASLAHALLAEEGAARGVQGYGGAEEGARHEARHHDGRREGDVEGALRGAVRETARPRRKDTVIPRRGDELPLKRGMRPHGVRAGPRGLLGAARHKVVRNQLGPERRRRRGPVLRRHHGRIASLEAREPLVRISGIGLPPPPRLRGTYH